MVNRLAPVAAALFLCSNASADIPPWGYRMPQNHVKLPGASSFIVPSTFPTPVFSSYYIKPTSTAQPQPAIYDPVLNITYPFELTNPETIPTNGRGFDGDEPLYPKALMHLDEEMKENLFYSVYSKVVQIVEISEVVDEIFSDVRIYRCSRCLKALVLGKLLAQTAPELVPSLLVKVCTTMGHASPEKCEEEYGETTYGPVWTQVLSLADVSGQDGRYICHFLNSKFCPASALNKLDKTGLFPKGKPINVKVPVASGKRVKVLHLSDFHLDSRYSVASEADCHSGTCCRWSPDVPQRKAAPAPLYGAYRCDTPYYLALAALQSIGPLTGTNTEDKPFAWSIYTGDLVAHESFGQLSRSYLQYTQTSVYSMFKKYIGGSVYAVLGNHDSNPKNLAGPNSLLGPLGEQYSWNYDHVAGLWEYNGWIDHETAEQARLHYAGYSVKNEHGLRIITLNTDFFYKFNLYNFIDTKNPDASGQFRFLIDELQSAEDAGERVWIIGHVLTGWDGSMPLLNPSDLFYQIIDRYSPHVIANTFWGHTHEDQFMIYYLNNGTVQDRDHAIMTGWIGPSVTPQNNLNSGFRMYEVDTGNFEIYNSYTFYADVNTFANLTVTGPTFEFEYSARSAYKIKWPYDAPLNATYWHKVTEEMEKRPSLVSLFNKFQGKSSIRTPGCNTKACRKAKICYMRSGSAALGRMCPQGYGSVQGPYKPHHSSEEVKGSKAHYHYEG